MKNTTAQTIRTKIAAVSARIGDMSQDAQSAIAAIVTAEPELSVDEHVAIYRQALEDGCYAD